MISKGGLNGSEDWMLHNFSEGFSCPTKNDTYLVGQALLARRRSEEKVLCVDHVQSLKSGAGATRNSQAQTSAAKCRQFKEWGLLVRLIGWPLLP